MNKAELTSLISKKQSYLCVGLDTDTDKLPGILKKEKDPVLTFNKKIIEATSEYAVAYKINTAFYEAQGGKGWETMQKTLEWIPKERFTIADAKRGDIGNTVLQYARAFFERMNFDAITVAPYMGRDSVAPFLDFKEKWVILLALTSNQSSADFQLLETARGKKLFEKVIETSQQWAGNEQMMYVVGATQTSMLQQIRQMIPRHFLLVPGVGAQGGSLKEVSEIALNEEAGLLVNASRSILFASSGGDFAEAAHKEAGKMQQEMKTCLLNKNFLS